MIEEAVTSLIENSGEAETDQEESYNSSIQPIEETDGQQGCCRECPEPADEREADASHDLDEHEVCLGAFGHTTRRRLHCVWLHEERGILWMEPGGHGGLLLPHPLLLCLL